MSIGQLTAMQMIFTRVEANYSPRRKSGYQTVYHSSGLSASDVQEIEKHVECFQANHPSLVRRQFFTLQSGYVVLTHSITIESIAEIVDKYQRGGVFLAHCLIFTEEQFEKADNNPFQIFDSFENFLDNAQEMIAQFNQGEGREARCHINIGKNRITGSTNWSSQEGKLATFIEEAAELKTKRKSLLFYGAEKDIDNTLRAAFDLAPKNKRLTCTFNSHIDRCMIRPGTYWAVGASSRQSGAYIPINLTLGKVEERPTVIKMKKRQIEAQNNISSAIVTTAVTKPYQPPNLTDLALNIADLLINQAPPLVTGNRYDWGAVEQLARQVQNKSLLFWSVLFNEKLEEERLQKMNEADFKRELQLIFNPIPAIEFFVKKTYLSKFFEKLAQERLRIGENQFVELVKAMIAVEELTSLNKLVNRVFYLKNEPLTLIEQELQSLHHTPKEFQFVEAVKKRREGLQKKSRFISALSALPRKILNSFSF